MFKQFSEPGSWQGFSMMTSMPGVHHLFVAPCSDRGAFLPSKDFDYCPLILNEELRI